MLDVMSVNEPERPAEGWKYAYVAGVFDFGTNLSISVQKSGSHKVGYQIQVKLEFSNSDKAALGFLDEFCETHGIDTRFRSLENSYRLEVGNRDDIELFLRLVQPYVIARHGVVEILLKNLLPGLELGKASSKEGFYELMEYVDEIRSQTSGRSNPKYDQAHFQNEWGM
jgi:hypothetical protein